MSAGIAIQAKVAATRLKQSLTPSRSTSSKTPPSAPTQDYTQDYTQELQPDGTTKLHKKPVKYVKREDKRGTVYGEYIPETLIVDKNFQVGVHIKRDIKSTSPTTWGTYTKEKTTYVDGKPFRREIWKTEDKKTSKVETQEFSTGKIKKFRDPVRTKTQTQEPITKKAQQWTVKMAGYKPATFQTEEAAKRHIDIMRKSQLSKTTENSKNRFVQYEGENKVFDRHEQRYLTIKEWQRDHGGYEWEQLGYNAKLPYNEKQPQTIDPHKIIQFYSNQPKPGDFLTNRFQKITELRDKAHKKKYEWVYDHPLKKPYKDLYLGYRDLIQGKTEKWQKDSNKIKKFTNKQIHDFLYKPNILNTALYTKPIDYFPTTKRNLTKTQKFIINYYNLFNKIPKLKKPYLHLKPQSNYFTQPFRNQIFKPYKKLGQHWWDATKRLNQQLHYPPVYKKTQPKTYPSFMNWARYYAKPSIRNWAQKNQWRALYGDASPFWANILTGEKDKGLQKFEQMYDFYGKKVKDFSDKHLLVTPKGQVITATTGELGKLFLINYPIWYKPYSTTKFSWDVASTGGKQLYETGESIKDMWNMPYGKTRIATLIAAFTAAGMNKKNANKLAKQMSKLKGKAYISPESYRYANKYLNKKPTYKIIKKIQFDPRTKRLEPLEFAHSHNFRQMFKTSKKYPKTKISHPRILKKFFPKPRKYIHKPQNVDTLFKELEKLRLKRQAIKKSEPNIKNKWVDSQQVMMSTRELKKFLKNIRRSQPKHLHEGADYGAIVRSRYWRNMKRKALGLSRKYKHKTIQLKKYGQQEPQFRGVIEDKLYLSKKHMLRDIKKAYKKQPTGTRNLIEEIQGYNNYQKIGKILRKIEEQYTKGNYKARPPKQLAKLFKGLRDWQLRKIHTRISKIYEQRLKSPKHSLTSSSHSLVRGEEQRLLNELKRQSSYYKTERMKRVFAHHSGDKKWAATPIKPLHHNIQTLLIKNPLNKGKEVRVYVLTKKPKKVPKINKQKTQKRRILTKKELTKKKKSYKYTKSLQELYSEKPKLLLYGKEQPKLYSEVPSPYQHYTQLPTIHTAYEPTHTPKIIQNLRQQTTPKIEQLTAQTPQLQQGQQVITKQKLKQSQLQKIIQTPLFLLDQQLAQNTQQKLKQILSQKQLQQLKQKQALSLAQLQKLQQKQKLDQQQKQKLKQLQIQIQLQLLTTYTPYTTQQNKFTLPLDEEKIRAFQAVLYKENGKQIKLKPNTTHQQAVQTGMHYTDILPVNKFTIKKITTNKDNTTTGKPYNKWYKFTKKGRNYQEKRHYRFDNKQERGVIQTIMFGK